MDLDEHKPEVLRHHEIAPYEFKAVAPSLGVDAAGNSFYCIFEGCPHLLLHVTRYPSFSPRVSTVNI